VEGLGLRVAGWSGRAGSVAIIELDPFEKCLAGCGGKDRVGLARHGYPLVPTARRYSVTWVPAVTPASTSSAFRIAG